MPKLSLRSLFSIPAILAIVVFTVASPSLVGLLHDDTGEPCLGPDDPFCSDHDPGAGSGGYGNYEVYEDCLRCYHASISNWSCRTPASKPEGDQCVIEFNDGVSTCRISGSCG